jgi:hypothetical protein
MSEKDELLEELSYLFPGETMEVVKGQHVRDLQQEGKLRIVATEPFFYIVSRP